MSDNKLKLYIQDHGYYGCIVVIAASEKEARKVMEDVKTYDPRGSIDEYAIKDGFQYVCWGDY